eukprot:1727609-Rhodomonas_salina.1
MHTETLHTVKPSQPHPILIYPARIYTPMLLLCVTPAPACACSPSSRAGRRSRRALPRLRARSAWARALRLAGCS